VKRFESDMEAQNQGKRVVNKYGGGCGGGGQSGILAL